MQNPRPELSSKSNPVAARMARLTDPLKGTLLNPGVNADSKAQRLSVYGRRLMSNRDLRVVEVAELLSDWASDDNQPNGVCEGFPLNSVVGLNLAINDFEVLSRRYTEDSEDAFTIFAHEWKWRPPVLRSLTPTEVVRWEMEVYNILYNYCLRPLEYETQTMNQFIAWLCSNGSMPGFMRIEVERECLRRKGEGIKYSDFLAYVKATVDIQPEEIQRKKRLAKFFANNEPPRFGAAGLVNLDLYKRTVIKIAQTNRDILVLWDEQFVSWLRRGLYGFPGLVALIDRRAFELAIRLGENRPPSCKDVHLLFGDLLIVMEHYIARERDHKTECRPIPMPEQPLEEVDPDDLINEILQNERELHQQRAEIQRKLAENRGTDEDETRLRLLDQNILQCVTMVTEVQQAQRRRKSKLEREATQRNIELELIMTTKPTAQDVEAQRAVLREIMAPQQYYTRLPTHTPSFSHRPVGRSVQTNLDPDHERQQRCRMAEIRRQKLTRRTT